MTSVIPINLAVEDTPSEAVLRRILHTTGRTYAIGTCFNRGGYGYIKRLISGINHAAKGTPFLVLTDLDDNECAPKLISGWLENPCHHNLMFRVAVREIESWILADREAFADFFGLDKRRIPTDTDAIEDPKQFLVDLMRKSRQGRYRRDMVPPRGSTSVVGRNYNGPLLTYINSSWRTTEAIKHSASLARTWNAALYFRPAWEMAENQD